MEERVVEKVERKTERWRRKKCKRKRRWEDKRRRKNEVVRSTSQTFRRQTLLMLCGKACRESGRELWGKNKSMP